MKYFVYLLCMLIININYSYGAENNNNNDDDDGRWAPYHSPYHFHFRFAIFIPSIIRLVLLLPIFKDIISENKVSIGWLFGFIQHFPILIKQFIALIPQVIIPIILTYILNKTVFLILFFLNSQKPFAWESWSLTPFIAIVLFLIVEVALLIADYLKVNQVVTTLKKIRDNLRVMPDKEKSDAKKCAQLLLDRMKDVENDEEKFNENYTTDEKKRKGFWQVVKKNLSEFLFEKLKKSINMESLEKYRMYSMIIVEGVATQLFMIFYLRLLYISIEYTIVFILIIGAIVYYGKDYTNKIAFLLENLEAPIQEGIVIDAKNWLSTSGVKEFLNSLNSPPEASSAKKKK